MYVAADLTQVISQLNVDEEWCLPREALAARERDAARYIKPRMSRDEVRCVIRHYFHDSPQVTVLLAPDTPAGAGAWQRVLGWFEHVALGAGVPSMDAEDVAVEALTSAMRALPAFGFRCSLGGWLYVIIKHASTRYFRGRKLVTSSLIITDEAGEEVAVDLPEKRTEEPEEIALHNERLFLLDATLRRLLKERDLAILRYSFFDTESIELRDGVARRCAWTDRRIAERIGLASASVPVIRGRILQRLAQDPVWQQFVVDQFGPDWARALQSRRLPGRPANPRQIGKAH
jgi:RNA polymerase sigma factor (sigma-70 family)